MRHPKFVQIVVGQWQGIKGWNYTLLGLDVEGEVWKLEKGRWIVYDTPRGEFARDPGDYSRDEVPF